jgi:hypothetical protein
MLNLYKSTNDTELEFRFQVSKEVFKKLITTVKGESTIEQSINFITEHSGKSDICQISFVNGVKQQTKYMSKQLIEKTNTIDSVIPYKIVLSKEDSIPLFNVNNSKLARIKLRLSVRVEALPNWRLDFTFVKTVANIKLNLKADKDKMLYKINPDEFIDKAPWGYEATLNLRLNISATRHLLMRIWIWY